MEKSIHEIHETLLTFLLERRKGDPEFTFNLRRTNRYNRLEQGYWFHGNDNYIAVSFWSGTDWRNRTPNIFFGITPSSCYLEISVSDSEDKQKFVEEQLSEALGLMQDGYRFRKIYAEGDMFTNNHFINILEEFLSVMGQKIVIDQKLRRYPDYQTRLLSNRIVKIPLSLFENQLSVINKKYRSINKQLWRESRLSQLLDLPNAILGIEIKNFLGIEHCALERVPETTQVIFLTGHNGAGKSSVLKAMYCSITGDKKVLEYLDDPGHYQIATTYWADGVSRQIQFQADLPYRVDPLFDSKLIIAYGPFRLNTNRKRDGKTEEEESNSHRLAEDATNSLFKSGESMLIDIEIGFQDWKNSGIKDDILKLRVESMIGIFREIIPGFRNIFWGSFDDELTWTDTLYQFKYTDESKMQTVTFDQLASGARSIINFVGDMIFRLFTAKPEESDVSELTGIVLIDEIDVHLHPENQKRIVEVLKDSFPKVQFIVTTHSPIPLLAGSDEDAIFIVKHESDKGVEVNRFVDVEFNKLTPNALLTSPIFGLASIFGSKKDSRDIRYESNWRELRLNDEVKSELSKIYKRLRGES